MEKTLEEQIHDVVSRFVRPPKFGELAGPPVLDISRPNIHETKPEFVAEKEAVQSAIASIRSLAALLYPNKIGGVEQPEHFLARRLRAHLDKEARSEYTKNSIESPIDLVAKNASDVGISACSLSINLDLWLAFKKREVELHDQEKLFWSGSSRPPNHYARTIALRLARIVAQETGEKPTIGVSRDGNHPSTDYGRALEEVFAILEINADFRRAGKWAIKQLTDNDMSRPFNALRGLGGNLGLGSRSDNRNALSGILGTMVKDQIG